jgi:hypothetical protein
MTFAMDILFRTVPSWQDTSCRCQVRLTLGDLPNICPFSLGHKDFGAISLIPATLLVRVIEMSLNWFRVGPKEVRFEFAATFIAWKSSTVLSYRSILDLVACSRVF